MTPSGKNLIVTAMVAVLTLTAVATLAITHLVTVGAIRDQARKVMAAVSAQTITRIVEYLQPARTIADLQAQIGTTGLTAPGAEADLERFFFEQLKRRPTVAGMHYGSRGGDFVYVTREVPGRAAPYLGKLVITSQGPRTTELILRGEDFTERGRRLDPGDDFDPRRRPGTRRSPTPTVRPGPSPTASIRRAAPG
jgi:hypothetical protein